MVKTSRKKKKTFVSYHFFLPPELCWLPEKYMCLPLVLLPEINCLPFSILNWRLMIMHLKVEVNCRVFRCCSNLKGNSVKLRYIHWAWRHNICTPVVQLHCNRFYMDSYSVTRLHTVNNSLLANTNICIIYMHWVVWLSVIRLYK